MTVGEEYESFFTDEELEAFMKSLMEPEAYDDDGSEDEDYE